MLKEVDKNIYLVEGKNKGRFPFCHSVLITDKITALIETGCGRNRLADIEKEFTPDVVIYSHGHPDIIAQVRVSFPLRDSGGLRSVKRRTETFPVWQSGS